MGDRFNIILILSVARDRNRRDRIYSFISLVWCRLCRYRSSPLSWAIARQLFPVTQPKLILSLSIQIYSLLKSKFSATSLFHSSASLAISSTSLFYLIASLATSSTSLFYSTANLAISSTSLFHSIANLAISSTSLFDSIANLAISSTR